MLVLSLIGLMLLGAGLGYALRNQERALKIAGVALTVVVHLLLFFLGISVGSNDELLSNLPVLGIQSLLFALLSMFASMLGAMWFWRQFIQHRMPAPSTKPSEEASPHSHGIGRAIMESATYMIAFALGIVAGWLLPIEAWLGDFDATLYILIMLMLLAGMAVGGDARTLSALRSMPLLVLLLPVVTVVATAIGALVGSLIFPSIDLRGGQAIGAGYAYYSLASVLIKEGFRPESQAVMVSAMALIANICREVLTICMAGPFARWFGPLAPISSAAATSGDTVLPFIMASSGREFAVASVYHGIVMTIWCPVAVGFVLAL